MDLQKLYPSFLVGLLVLLSFLVATDARAQNFNSDNLDFVYQDHIASVKFHIAGIVLSYPIVELNSPARLELRFDDFDGEKDYIYTIRHCNADWTFRE